MVGWMNELLDGQIKLWVVIGNGWVCGWIIRREDLRMDEILGR